MNRRASLRRLMAASGALVALPAWASGWSISDFRGGTSFFSMAEEELLGHVADTIIPAGNSIGALSVGVDKFLLKLFSNCYEAQVQENIKAQLMELDASSKRSHGKAFTSCDQRQRQEFCMTSTGTQNPTLTYMAITARAANYAVEALKKRNL